MLARVKPREASSISGSIEASMHGVISGEAVTQIAELAPNIDKLLCAGVSQSRDDGLLRAVIKGARNISKGS